MEAYATWAKGCSGTVLTQVQRSEMVDRCAAHAALPGVDIPKAAFDACAGEIPASSCAWLPLDCLTPFYGLSGHEQPTSVWVGEGSLADYELIPRVKGTLPAGAACDLAWQCQSGECTSQDQCGICVDRVAVGACGGSAPCDFGGSCQNGVCVVAGVPEGMPCQAAKGASNCAPDLYCPNGTCVPRLHVGDACPAGIASFEACPRGSVCQASVCQSITTVHEGEACDGVTAVCSGEGIFCVGGACRKPVANVGEGGACTVDVCALGLACSYAVCTKAAPAGAACKAGSCDANLLCMEDAPTVFTCHPPRAEGDACGGERECAIPLFCLPSGTTQRCQRGVSQGEACKDGSLLCGDGLSCVEGVCSALGVCSAR